MKHTNKDWFKKNGQWYHFNGSYLDGKKISIELGYLLGLLFDSCECGCEPEKKPTIIRIWRLSWKNRIRAILGLSLEDINYWGKTKQRNEEEI